MNLQRCLICAVFLALLSANCEARRRSRDHFKTDQSNNATNKEEKMRQRQGKVFSLFSVVSFSNTACRSTSTLTGGSAPNRNGTCFTTSECVAKSGSISGTCASGFGVCCVFVVSAAASTVNQNCTYIQNPGFPAALTTTAALSYTINKCSSDVCSLRLDFETFTLLGPGDTLEGTGGLCQDSFTVTVTTAQQIPVICGQNTGQHMYIDMGGAAGDTSTLAFAFTGSSNVRQWEIKVTQIPCAAGYKAPDGCLQYVTGLTGRLTSFNFLDAAGSSHLQNQAYTQCIRQEAGFCCIQWQTCQDANSFTLDETIAQNAGIAATLVDNACTLDFVTIIGATANCQPNTGVTQTERICGNFFSTFTGAMADAIVCDCSTPFQLGIRTDALADTASITAGVVNRGVCLVYTQIPC